MVDEKLAPSGRDGAEGGGRGGRERDRRARRARYTRTHVRIICGCPVVVYRYARGASACRAIRESARGEGWRPNEEERRVGKRKGNGVGRRTEGKIRDTSDYRHGDCRLLLLALSIVNEGGREREM